MVINYAHAKGQGERSLSSKDRVETNGQTDKRTDGQRRLHYSHADVVNKGTVEWVYIQNGHIPKRPQPKRPQTKTATD